MATCVPKEDILSPVWSHFGHTQLLSSSQFVKINNAAVVPLCSVRVFEIYIVAMILFNRTGSVYMHLIYIIISFFAFENLF